MKRFWIFSFILLAGCKYAVVPQSDPDGNAVNYRKSGPPIELPSSVRPNDATISLYEEGRRTFLSNLKGRGNVYTIKPSGNALPFQTTSNPKSEILETQLAEGYILSYLYFDNGVIKYDGKPAKGRFDRDIDDETLFFTHSTGKSIVSYLVGHAICEGYIGSIDEPVDWPLMSSTLYQGQPLRALLNMSAGDKHTIDSDRSHYIMGSPKHHRDMDLETISILLKGTEKKGDQLFYNNFLADLIASYVAHKTDSDYDSFLNKIFQDKVGIENEVHFELHRKTTSASSKYYGSNETRASYSFLITRKDLLRVGLAMMKDYQGQTCVGKYLREAQAQAKRWPKYRPNKDNARFWLHNYAQNYGAQFYFKFQGMDDRNILATEGYNGQNMMIDMDNSRIVVTHSAATAWDQRLFIRDVIRDGKLPK